jgi:type II secretory pathway pseudopilin PulG
MILSRKAFTLIELIFIIVIVSILSVVAIPRLQVTRDDAKVSTSLNEVSQIVSDMSAYYMAKEHYESDNVVDVTNVRLYNSYDCISDNIATNIVSSSSYYYCTEKGSELEVCVKIFLSNIDGNLTVSSILNPEGDICKGLHESRVYQYNLLKTFLNGGATLNY